MGSVRFFIIQQKECIKFFKSEKKTFIIFQDSSQNPENVILQFYKYFATLLLYCITDSINAKLVSIKYFLQKHLKNVDRNILNGIYIKIT